MSNYIKVNNQYREIQSIYKKISGTWTIVNSEWDVSNVTNMMGMFMGCKLLMSVGDISSWNISKVRMMRNMFKHCNVDIIPDWYDITIHDKKVSTDNSMMIEDITLEG